MVTKVNYGPKTKKALDPCIWILDPLQDSVLQSQPPVSHQPPSLLLSLNGEDPCESNSEASSGLRLSNSLTKPQWPNMEDMWRGVSDTQETTVLSRRRRSSKSNSLRVAMFPSIAASESLFSISLFLFFSLPMWKVFSFLCQSEIS
ncbi:hypothetical protein ACB094_04G161000 [Castanea mollissima]